MLGLKRRKLDSSRTKGELVGRSGTGGFAMLKYTLLLHGLQSREEGLPGALLRDLLDAVNGGATPRPLCTSLALCVSWDFAQETSA
jgi:hypothetical protein